jgi:hypothetical protein
MGDMQSLGGAIHTEEMKVESYFETHPAAIAIGVAVAAGLICFAVIMFFKI